MRIEVFGDLEPHAGIVLAGAAVDLYQMLISEASRMQWLDTHPGTRNGQPVVGADYDGLWGPHDAGGNWHPSAAEAGVRRLLWGQVGVVAPQSDTRPSPIQPLVSCAERVLCRLGNVRLTALQVLAPLHLSGGFAFETVQGLSVFVREASPAIAAEISLSDTSAQVAAVASSMLAKGQLQNSEAFRLKSLKITGTAAIFGVEMPEWSFDAAGFVMAFLAQLAREAGVSAATWFTVTVID